MKSAGARSELIGGDALGQTILRRENRTQDVELRDHFKRRVDVSLKPLRFRLNGGDPIERNFILKIHAPADPVAELAALDPGNKKKVVVDLPADRARSHAPVAAPNQHGKFLDDLVLDRRTELWLTGFERDRLGRDLNPLRDVPGP